MIKHRYFTKLISLNRYKSALLVLIMVLHIGQSYSQINQSVFENFRHYTEEDGLPSSYISGIAEDKNGFLWLATANGISRFDGSHFTNYTSLQRDSISKKIGFVESLVFDTSGVKFWVGISEGIFSSTIEDFNLKSIQAEVPQADSFPCSKAELMLDNDNILWSSNQKEGLLKFNLRSQKVDHFQFLKGSSTDKFLLNNVTCLAQDPIDTSILWIGTIAGLIRYNKIKDDYQAYTYANQPELAQNRIRTIEVSESEVFLGTWSKGLLLFDKKSEYFRTLFDGRHQDHHYLILDLFKENDSILWITSNDGLLSYDLKNREIKNTIVNEESKGNIRGLSFIDSRGILWYCSGKGLFKYDPQQSQHLFIELEKRNSVEPPLMLRKIIYSNGFYFALGISGSGIYKINASDYSFDVIDYPMLNIKNEPDRTLRDMVEMEDGNFLVVSKEITLFSPRNNRIRLSPLQIDHPSPSVQAVVRDSKENYWIGTRAAGLYRLNFKNNTITKFKNEFDVFRDGNYRWINRLFIDSHNILWIAKGSASLLNLNDTTVQCLDIRENEKVMSFQDVLGFYEDKSGRVWMAGGKDGLGFTSYKDFRKGITHLFDGYFSGIYPYNDSLVFTSGRNLGILNLNSNKYSELKLKANNKLLRVSGPVVPGQNNDYLVSCDNGILVFDPAEHVLNPEFPSPYINEIIIDGKKRYQGNSFTNLNFEFESTAKHIVFKLGALGFHFPDEITYRYNLDNEWHDIGPNNEIQFTNLSYGNYKLQIKACNNRGECSSTPLLCNISVLTPWWASWWAILIYLAIVIFFADRFYRFQLSKRLAIAESKRLKDVSELKNNLYANITHEFRTPLTVILGMADSIKTGIQEGQLKATEHAVEMIRRNGNKMLKLVNDMLDLSKLEGGKMELHLIQADAVRFLKYLSEGFHSLAKEKNINFILYAESGELLMDFDTNKLSAIVSNMLSNAIKFTPEGGNIIVHLKHLNQGKNEFLVIKIKDSGKGIPQAELLHIFERFYQSGNTTIKEGRGTGIGLSLTKEFVDLMGGSIEVKSAPGEGSEFIVRIPVTNKASQVKDVDLEFEHNLPLIPTTNEMLEPETDADSESPLALIIEDNADVAHYLKTCLTGRYQTRQAVNGQEGLDLAFEIIPDVVICDVMMPVKDGFTVCSELKADERTDHIPVIMLTAKVTMHDRIKGLSRGADAYLTKPFVKAELLTRLEQLVLLRKKMMQKMGNNRLSHWLNTNAEDPESKFLQKIIAIIHEEISNHSFGSSVHLSRKMKLSESQIYRKLKAITGKSTAVFIRSVRLQKAKELIQTTDKTISEIAYEVGFNDPSWFNRAFKEEFGYTPGSIAR